MSLDCRGLQSGHYASEFLGMNSKWFSVVVISAVSLHLGEGIVARVISAALFLATKLEAFSDRGEGDYYGSKDIEDIVTLVEARATIVQDVRDSVVVEFVSSSFAALLEQPDFRDALPGHLSDVYGARQRIGLVRARFGQIAALRSLR